MLEKYLLLNSQKVHLKTSHDLELVAYCCDFDQAMGGAVNDVGISNTTLNLVYCL